MNKDLVAIFDYMEREKGIKRGIVIGAIEESLCAAAKKTIDGSANVSVHINPKTGDIEVLCEKEIVEELVTPSKEILLEEAQELDPDCEVGQFLDVVVKAQDFGRIAAQKARQIIMQKLRGAERDVIYEEYRHRVNEIISGTVKRRGRGADLIVDLGKVEAILPARNYPKTERYHNGERVLALLLEVQDTENGGAEVILTRAHPEFVARLFSQEVPEVEDGTVTISKIVRDPGYRTKVVVKSSDSRVDPVGACVGMRGSRIKNIIRELNNEKIDIIPFAENPLELLANAMSPININKMFINDEQTIVSIVVDDEDFATVIGKRGMNARLNGELIKATLEVQKISEHKRAMTLQRNQLAESEDETLDEEIKLAGLNKLIFENLIEAGFTTPRKVLIATPEELSSVPGISIELADKIFEQISNERI
ncbi:MAG: N utilization substance protein A [Chlamydiales bacterium]|jgi:N utilization substance protein A